MLAKVPELYRNICYCCWPIAITSHILLIILNNLPSVFKDPAFFSQT